MSKSKKDQTKNPRRLDPAMLLELLDNHYDDDGAGKGASWYQKLYKQNLDKFLTAENAVDMANLLENVDAAVGVETAMRSAGFIVGFECCRRLMFGELDLSQLKDGAR